MYVQEVKEIAFCMRLSISNIFLRIRVTIKREHQFHYRHHYHHGISNKKVLITELDGG